MRKTHGLTANKESRKVYTAWLDINRRCYDESCKHFEDYGGRGIKVAAEWQTDPVAFYTYVSGLPGFGLDKSIDRVDNSLGYEPGNLRWATPRMQVLNRRSLKNNTSGVKNVTWYFNNTGGTRAIAWWKAQGKSKSKSFPVKRYGLLPAFKLAALEQSHQIIINT
jgi:hypothetical protein